MDTEILKQLVKEIVKKAAILKNKHTAEKDVPVNYACIFAQSTREYTELLTVTGKIGSVAMETAMGPVYRIQPLQTVAGMLQLLKIRKPDPTRPERGDADFTWEKLDKADDLKRDAGIKDL